MQKFYDEVNILANVDMQAFDKIIVLDFGSQYNQLITRRIREFGIYSELLSHKITAEEIKQMAPKGIVFLVVQTVSTMKEHLKSILRSLI